MLNKLRAMRILHLGRRIAQHKVSGATLISLCDQSEERKFISATEGTGLSNELMKELEELSLNKEKQPIIANSPVPSESASSKGSSEIDSLIAEFGRKYRFLQLLLKQSTIEYLPQIIINQIVEKRGGILKPQGSLERNRDIGDLVISSENNCMPSSARKPRQNVAMQAIMRRAETEQKQVTFKNVSPVIIEEAEKNKATVISTIPVSIVTSSTSPAKTNNVKAIVASSSTSNTTGTTIVSAPPIQPRPPLMPNAPLNIHKPAMVQQNQQQGQKQHQQYMQHQQVQPQQQQPQQVQIQPQQQNKVLIAYRNNFI